MRPRRKGPASMFGLGIPELIVIMIFALIFFGPGRLPEVGAALGKSLREFKDATRGITAGDEEPRKLPPSEDE